MKSKALKDWIEKELKSLESDINSLKLKKQQWQESLNKVNQEITETEEKLRNLKEDTKCLEQ